MYDLLAEIFVYGLALAYFVLFVILAQYWIRNMVRASRKPHTRSAPPPPPQS